RGRHLDRRGRHELPAPDPRRRRPRRAACGTRARRRARRRCKPDNSRSRATMTRIGKLAGAALIGAVALGGTPERGDAHHSFAMYDRGKTETLTGRLTRFIPGANHAQLHFELIDADGEPVLGDDGEPVTWG